MSLIELRQVSKIYTAGDIPVAALDSVNLVIEEGEFVCIAGPSGSGKTTLLNLIGCTDTPSHGTVSVAGDRMDRLTRTKAAAFRLRRIGFIFQAFNLIPVLTAYENVEYVLMLKGIPSAERSEIVRNTLASVGLAGQMGKFPGQLSGGEQQRVAVARAIVGSPPVVLADEPTANLDSRTGRNLVSLFRSLNRERGTTFIFSSHDPMIVGQADRCITLADGRISEDRRGTREG
jgi:putative ABC transport system ATP-binding protein